ncbi:MAG: putative pyridoxamine 5'-phosphate oxidase family protein [Sulfurimonas sp.]|jgi:uncharacterized pyridoxamine 5'-phosphate oxidase family protein/NAD-dependent dihydropyrimidine dehydrogenase PreA subunit
MSTQKYFEILTEEIHSVVVATVDENGLPTTRVIDMMLHDDSGIYFLTAKGKTFYKQLMEKSYLCLSGILGEKASMSKKAISLSGSVRNLGSDKLKEIFIKNPYMVDIYPSIESRKALDVFCIYKGQGEYFDLSTKPITRGSFTFGGKKLQEFGYIITDDCVGCSKCAENCPQDCIDEGEPFVINQEHCLHCGYCYDICPSEAIVKKA